MVVILGMSGGMWYRGAKKCCLLLHGQQSNDDLNGLSSILNMFTSGWNQWICDT